MDEFKKVGKEFKRNTLITALLLIVVGILFVAFPQSSGTVICYVTGAVLTAWGIVVLVTYFASGSAIAFGSFGLLLGALLATLGACILIHPDFLKGILTIVFGIVIIVDAVLKLQYAVDLMRIHASGWWIVLLTAVLMGVLGVVVLLNPFSTAAVLMVYLGVVLIVDGATDLATISYITSSVKKVKKAVKDTLGGEEKAEETPAGKGGVVDVDYKDVK